MTQEYATGKARGQRRAAATKTLTAGTYTIIAYQGTAEQHTEKARMTADWDGTAFTLHGSGGKKAYMELEPGDYTFVCFNDRLEEKDGALVIAKDGTTPTSDDYAQALAGTAAATVSAKSTKVSLVLSHPFARVTFRIVGNGLDVTAKDYDYSDVQNPKEISYTTKIGTNAYLESATETLDLQRLNPVSLLPEKADASAHTADGASGKRPLSFGAITTGATTDAPAAWLKQFQYAQSNTLYFPAGTSLRNYDVTEDGGTATMIYGKTVSLADLFSTAMPDGTLQANTSYTVLIYVSYNFRYLFNDGTVGTLADNWRTKTPIAIVTSMKEKAAMALRDAGNATWTTRAKGKMNNSTFGYNTTPMFTDPYGYEYSWNPAYSYDGVTVKATSDEFPAFKIAAQYNPGAELTAEWLKNPSDNVDERAGKWYIPSYGEIRTAYQSIMHGNFARKSGSKIEIREFTRGDSEYYLFRGNLLNIGFSQAGGKADESLAVFAQGLVVDARLVIKTVYVRDGIQLDEIFVSLFVFCQKDKVLKFARIVLDLVVVRHVQFAADDRLDLVFAALFCKLQRRIHIPVVGNGDRLDIVLDAVRNQFFYLARPVQQAVFRMKM